MDSTWKEPLWRQFGAAIDMLENAIVASPDIFWTGTDGGGGSSPRASNLVYHTLYWLDLYLTEDEPAYVPPPPFTFDERQDVEPPNATYRRDDLLAFLGHCRARCRATITELDNAAAHARCGIPRHEMSRFELLLYNLRHVQHHAAQLNLMLREEGIVPPRWVRRGADRGES